MVDAKPGGVTKAESLSDQSTVSLVAANLFAAAIAVAFKLSLHDLLLVYWVQSVVIGLSFFIRILKAKRYAILPEPPQQSPYIVFEDGEPAAKKSAAAGFATWFISVHAIYLGYLVFDTGVAVQLGTGLVLCALAFVLDLALMLPRSIRLDRGGIANLSLMMYLPYLRIVPMQAVILLGVHFAGGTAMMLLFIAIKTAIDVLMHVMELQEWRRPGPPVVPDQLQG